MSVESQPSRKLQIRKYPNRRYYDISRSRHVTLEEIYRLVREGYDVQVTDSRSRQDITEKVLTQIILELDSPKLAVFPIPLLHKLLRSSEQMVTDFVQKYFTDAFDSFIDSQRSMEHLMRSAMGLKSNAPTVADLTKIFWSPLTDTAWSGAAPPALPAGPAAVQTPDRQELRATLEQLQEELSQMRREEGRKTRRAKS